LSYSTRNSFYNCGGIGGGNVMKYVTHEY